MTMFVAIVAAVLSVVQARGSSDPPPTDVRAIDRLISRGEVPEALSRSRHLVAAFPRSADAHAVAGDAAGAMAGRAGILRLFQLARECRQHYRIALTLDSGNVRAMEGMIGYLAQAPAILGGDKDAAQRLAQTLERTDSSRGRIARALVLVAKKSARSLSDSLARSAAGTSGETVLARVAEYYTAVGQIDVAERVNRQRLAGDSESVAILHDLARSQLAVGDTTGALRTLVRAWRNARIAGDFSWVPAERLGWRLAEVNLRHGDEGQARAWADSVLLARPNHAKALHLRDALARAGTR